MKFVGRAAPLPNPWPRATDEFVEAAEPASDVQHAEGYELFLQHVAAEGVSTARWGLESAAEYFTRHGRDVISAGVDVETSAAIYLGNAIIAAAGGGHWARFADDRPELSLGAVLIDTRAVLGKLAEGDLAGFAQIRRLADEIS